MRQLVFIILWFTRLFSLPFKILKYSLRQVTIQIQMLWRGTLPLWEYVEQEEEDLREFRKALQDFDALL